MVAITGANLSPEYPSWRDAFATWQERCRIVFTAGSDGRVYARHGTNADNASQSSIASRHMIRVRSRHRLVWRTGWSRHERPLLQG
jgi:hypothetical protein